MTKFLIAAMAASCVFAQTADVEAGRQLYAGACSGCHGAAGEGSQGPSLLSGRVARMSGRALVNTIKNGLPGTTMPNFPLAADKLEQLAAFLKTLTAPAVAVPRTGDPVAGRTLFMGTARCSRCHMVNGEGGYPGPDLSNIGAERTLPQLRESLMKPSARIAEGFRTASVTLKNGHTIQGVAKNYNNYSAHVLDSAGRLHIFRTADVTRIDIGADSLMPSFTDASAAGDLLAYLASLSRRPYEGEQQ